MSPEPGKRNDLSGHIHDKPNYGILTVRMTVKVMFEIVPMHVQWRR